MSNNMQPLALRRDGSYTSIQERRLAEEAARAPPLPVLHRNPNKSDLNKAHDAFMEGKVVYNSYSITSSYDHRRSLLIG